MVWFLVGLNVVLAAAWWCTWRYDRRLQSKIIEAEQRVADLERQIRDCAT